MADQNTQNNVFAPFGATPMTKEEEDDFLANFEKAAEILFGEDGEEKISEENMQKNNPSR